ncbi:helix-turn-helix transcriptional regulator [Neorhizobium galegae]|uniref:ATP-binding protein n=1 Tax=Neorhizobium galegae TaxID=399 RepID=UPI0021014E1A|nr:winged helix-turn-helix domain-containing protein [Neorhizobium galegae]MCQ1574624.1 helix-turn-helix transcriptional regulator [Neorhizobium galegae]
MMEHSARNAADAVSFDGFSLFPTQRQLLKDGKPVSIGSRAFDLLCALVARPGEVLSTQELISIVWRNIFVDEANLRVNLTHLRRALGEGEGKRYIVNIPGRGYMFRALLATPQTRPTSPGSAFAQAAASSTADLMGEEPQPLSLPRRISRVIGRDDVIQSLAAKLTNRRFLTVVGPGGIGKTTVALSVADQLLSNVNGQAILIDLAPILDPAQVPNSVAAALGLAIRTHDESESILEFLKGRTLLLIFDGCEHLAEAVASLVERIYLAKSNVYVLATSREPLRVVGENIHRLEPLAVPPEDDRLTAADIQAYSAVELFVERLGGGLEVTPESVFRIAEICRRLDGVALAIELAAGRAGTYGIEGLAARLDDRFKLLTLGRRTALPRQQTLRATIDWSYTLLAEQEQKILRHCGIFPDVFSLEGLAAVLGTGEQCDLGDAVESLVDKSLIVVKVTRDSVHYRLLDSMRAYAVDRLGEVDERNAAARRHALHVCGALGAERLQAGANLSSGLHITVADVRAALVWCFSGNDDRRVAVSLATDAGAFFLERSLLTECADWSEKALAILTDDERGSHQEVELLSNFAMPILFTRGGNDVVRSSLSRAIALLENRDDYSRWARLLRGLYVCHLREGNFRGMREVAERSQIQTFAEQSRSQNSWMMGLCQYFSGEHAAATETLSRALTILPVKRRVGETGVDPRVNAYNALARSQWFRGFADQALLTSGRNLAESAALDHPVSHCIALTWMAPIPLWTGDLDLAEQRIAELVETANRGALAPSRLAGSAWQGVIATRRGDHKTGLHLLQSSIDGMIGINNRLLHIIFLGHLAEALAAGGRLQDAIRAIDDAMALVDLYGETVNMPLLLRLRGDYLLALDPNDLDAAQTHYMRSLEWAERQGALAMELRTTLSLMKVHEMRGNSPIGRALLMAVYRRFTEGFSTADLVEARRVLSLAEGS